MVEHLYTRELSNGKMEVYRYRCNGGYMHVHVLFSLEDLGDRDVYIPVSTTATFVPHMNDTRPWHRPSEPGITGSLYAHGPGASGIQITPIDELK